MATIQQGTMALVFGAPDADIDIAGHDVPKESASGIILSEVGFTAMAQEVRTMNETGNTVNITTFDAGAEATLTIKPRGTTVANAVTAAGYFPKVGDVCTIVNAAAVSTHTDPDFSAASPGRTYRVKAASKNMGAGQHVTWNVTIERLDAIPSMVPLA